MLEWNVLVLKWFLPEGKVPEPTIAHTQMHDGQQDSVLQSEHKLWN